MSAQGSISKRRYKSGRVVWRAQLPVGRKKVEKAFERKQDATRWMTAQRSALQRGDWIDPADGRKTFSEVAAEWRELTFADLEPKTRAGYTSLLAAMEREFGRDRIAAVDTAALQAYVGKLRETRSPETVRRYFTVLQNVLKLAVERRYIGANPCASVRLPKGDPKKEQLFLSPREVHAVAEAIDPHWRTAVLVAAYTGLRAGELWALRRNDIDLLHGTLRVDESLKDVAGHLEFGRPKTDGSVRTIALPKTVLDLLAEHLDPERGCVGSAPDALVFTTPSGGPVSQGNFYQRVFKPTVRRGTCTGCEARPSQPSDECPECGESISWVLPPAKHGLRFHDLRNTCASLSLSVSPDIYAVSKRLGHASITTTVDTYGHLLPDADAAIAASLDALMTAAQAPQPSNIVAIR